MVCGVNVNRHRAESMEQREIQWAARRRQLTEEKKDIGSLVSCPWPVARCELSMEHEVYKTNWHTLCPMLNAFPNPKSEIRNPKCGLRLIALPELSFH
jgi:hypothetical protein